MKLWILRSLPLLLGGLAASIPAQSQVLFEEDFENGLGSWTMMGAPWHVSAPGDCGAGLSQAAKFGPACSYPGAFGRLISPDISFQASTTVLLTMDVVWDMDPVGLEAVLQVTLDNPGTGFWMGKSFDVHDKGVKQTLWFPFDVNAVPAGDPWTITLSIDADSQGNTGMGLFVDNLRLVTNAATDLGYALPAGTLPPQLDWLGDFSPGSKNLLQAWALPELSTAFLVVGDVLQPELARGVVVSPKPLLVLPLATGESDDHLVPDIVGLTIPVGAPSLPPGTPLYLQLLTVDPAAAWSASNTLQLVSP